MLPASVLLALSMPNRFGKLAPQATGTTIVKAWGRGYVCKVLPPPMSAQGHVAARTGRRAA